MTTNKKQINPNAGFLSAQFVITTKLVERKVKITKRTQSTVIQSGVEVSVDFARRKTKKKMLNMTKRIQFPSFSSQK